MTPAEHIEHAEALLSDARRMDNDWTELERLALAVLGIGHALIATAVELGAPHNALNTGVPSGG